LRYASNGDKKPPRKSWIPTEDELLQKVTTQALIHEISLQQMHGVEKVVPWFLKTMPVNQILKL